MNGSGLAAWLLKDKIASLRDEVAQYTAELDKNAEASKRTEENTRSLGMAAAVRSAVPEIGKREDLGNQLSTLQQARSSTDASLSPAVAAGLDQAIARTKSELENVKSAAQLAMQASTLAAQAADARSPGELAAVAYQTTYNQLINQGMSVQEASDAASEAGSTARVQALDKIAKAELARSQKFADAIGMTEADTASIGKNAFEVDLLKENWKAYAEIRDLAQKHNTAFDDAEYARVVQLNTLQSAAAAKLEAAQLTQSFLSPEQVQAQSNTKMLALYKADGNNYGVYLNQKALADYDFFKAHLAVNQGLYASMYATANAGIELLNAYGSQSKTAAIAAIALGKAVAIAQIIQNTAAASAAALAPPPIGYGPVLGVAAVGAIQAFGAAQIALAVATGVAQASSISSPAPAVPAASAAAAVVPAAAGTTAGTAATASAPQAPTVNLYLQGETYSKETVRKLIQAINQTVGNGVKLNISAA